MSKPTRRIMPVGQTRFVGEVLAMVVAETPAQAKDGADALVIVTDWNEYRFPDFGRIKSSLKAPVVIDGRNLYDPAKMAQLGFTYRSVGRGRE